MQLAFAMIVVAMLAGNSPRDIEHTKDSLETIKKNVDGGEAVLVDVRSDEEWNEGHIEGSIFVPVTSLRKGGDPKQLAKVLPKEKVLYTFCVVGMRAKTAAYELSKHGYKVRAVKPGYDDLLKAGFKKAELAAIPPTADEARDRALLSFVTISDNALPEHIRLRKKVRSSAILPVAENPTIVADRRQLDFITKFFGVKEEADLKSIVIGVVVIYEDDITEKEIGIWGIYYDNQKAADERFNAILAKAKDAKKKGRIFPFVQKGRLLLFAWNDSIASKDDFAAMLKYLKAKKFTNPD